ncbi:phosphoenolpyruvate--protein phosphotransferase, partial [Escherichia coli]|nr:phosphoenolpyruvate--protein phosphotransferase [Escherichia coli]
YLRAREADLLDLRDTIIAALLGRAAFELPAGPPAILLADELPPSVALGLDPAQVLGVIERRGGATSHAAILLRGAGIPAIANAGGLVPADAATVAFDGATGAVLFDPTPEQSAPFLKARDEEKLDASGSPLIDGSIEMRDGRRIELWANVVGVGDAKAAVKAGALGIGLLRTEMMFLDRQEAPGEIEQMRELKAMFDVFTG